MIKLNSLFGFISKARPVALSISYPFASEQKSGFLAPALKLKHKQNPFEKLCLSLQSQKTDESQIMQFLMQEYKSSPKSIAQGKLVDRVATISSFVSKSTTLVDLMRMIRENCLDSVTKEALTSLTNDVLRVAAVMKDKASSNALLMEWVELMNLTLQKNDLKISNMLIEESGLTESFYNIKWYSLLEVLLNKSNLSTLLQNNFLASEHVSLALNAIDYTLLKKNDILSCVSIANKFGIPIDGIVGLFSQYKDYELPAELLEYAVYNHKNGQAPTNPEIKPFMSALAKVANSEGPNETDLSSLLVDKVLPQRYLAQIVEIFLPNLKKIPATQQKTLVRVLTGELKASQQSYISSSIRFQLAALVFLKNCHSSVKPDRFLDNMMIKAVISSFTTLESALYVLAVLIESGIYHHTMLEFLAENDMGKHLNFNTSQFFSYIRIYRVMFLKSHEEKATVFKNIRKIEDLIHAKAPHMTLYEKCVSLNLLKMFSFPAKRELIAKPISKELPQLADPLVLADIFLLFCHSHYIDLDFELFEQLIESKIDQLSLKHTIDVMMGLIWHNKGSLSIWEALLKRAAEQTELKIFDFGDKINSCRLYQIFFSLQSLRKVDWNNHLAKIIEGKFSIEKLEAIYYERPNLPDYTESNRSESDVEQILNKLGFKFEMQHQIGIFKVDFLIEDHDIIELHGRHHYCERGVLNGPSIWREKLLESMGYKVTNISVSEWSANRDENRKLEIIKTLIPTKPSAL